MTFTITMHTKPNQAWSSVGWASMKLTDLGLRHIAQIPPNTWDLLFEESAVRHWSTVDSYDLGICTDATLLSPCAFRDSQKTLWFCPVVYKDEHYAIRDAWEELKAGRAITWLVGSSPLQIWEGGDYRVTLYAPLPEGLSSEVPSSLHYQIFHIRSGLSLLNGAMDIQQKSLGRPYADPWYVQELFQQLRSSERDELLTGAEHAAYTDQWLETGPWWDLINRVRTEVAPLLEIWSVPYTTLDETITCYVYQDRVEVWAFAQRIYTLPIRAGFFIGINAEPLCGVEDALIFCDDLLGKIQYANHQCAQADYTPEDVQRYFRSEGIDPTTIPLGAYLAAKGYIGSMDILSSLAETFERLRNKTFHPHSSPQGMYTDEQRTQILTALCELDSWSIRRHND